MELLSTSGAPGINAEAIAKGDAAVQAKLDTLN